MSHESVDVFSLPGFEDPEDDPNTVVRLPRGTSLGRYIVLDLLGEGGLGTVYTAYDPELDRRVAIKVVRPSAVNEALGSQAERLLREAQAMARLSHPNVVTVHDVGRVGDEVFIAMELIDGIALSDWMKDAHPWPEVRGVFVEAAKGLAAAHQAGLVHRDFKPSNVLLSLHHNGSVARVRVLDFGLARGTAAPSRPTNPAFEDLRNQGLSHDLTLDGMVMGTPMFMAPEALAGHPVGPQADQFGFCVTMWMTLFGRRPFGVGDIPTLIQRIAAGDIEEPVRSRRVPAWMVRTLRKGLSFNAEQRYPSMEALIEALQVDRRSRRRQWWLAGAATFVLAGGATAWFLVQPPSEATLETQKTIETITTAARRAAARQYYVYPPADDQAGDTAFKRVIELESLDLEGAQQRALELRDEFAETLIRVGDGLYEQPGGRPFATDFYASALIFRPDDAHARARSSLTRGEQADLRTRARTADFSPDELVAAESLAVLADPDQTSQRRRAQALATRKHPRAVVARSQLQAVLRPSSSIDVPATPGTEPDTPTTAIEPDPESPDDVEIVDIELDDEKPVKPGSSAANHGRNTARTSNSATPSRPSPDDDDPAIASQQPVNPALARSFAREGHAALRNLDTARAETLFHQALAHDRREASALAGLSEVYFEQGSYQKAVQFAKKAVGRRPRSGAYRILLGDGYFKTLAYTSAREQYLKAKEFGHPKARQRLEQLDARLGGN